MHGTNTTSLFIFNFRREEVIKVEEIIDEIEIINPHGFVYCTTNMINGKKYIGQRKFYGNWKSYLGSGLLLTKAIKKYKRDNFTKEIIYIRNLIHSLVLYIPFNTSQYLFSCLIITNRPL